MSAALALDPVLPAEADWRRANRAPTSPDLGTCVKFSRFGGEAAYWMGEEGVVIETVPPKGLIRSTGVRYLARQRRLGSTVRRYVVQSADERVVRRAAEFVVVAL